MAFFYLVKVARDDGKIESDREEIFQNNEKSSEVDNKPQT